MNNENIIIKPTNMASGITMWNKQVYLRDWKKIIYITNVRVYGKLEGGQIVTTNKKGCKVVDIMWRKKK